VFGFRLGAVYQLKPMNDDATLLRRYADDRSEAAFSELVHRHVDLVYSAAVRRTGGDSHRAADVVQQVFATLARNARKLSRHSVLQAWLHTATKNASLNLMISEQRRRARELESASFGAASSANPEFLDWERIKPVLDGAIDELPGPDREAVVLRFLERREFSEIGAALRMSSDAARMRTARALEKLRVFLSRRGITSTSAALGAIVTNQSLISAPAGLAPAVASASMASTAAGIGLAASLMTTKVMSTAVICGLLAFGAGAYYGRTLRVLPSAQPAADNPEQSRAIASLRQSNATLQADLDRVDTANIQLNAAVAQLNAKLAAAVAAAAAPRKNLSIGGTPRELKKTILNNLRQIDAARTQYRLENNKDPESVEVLVGDQGYIRRLHTVGGEDYSGLSLGPGQVLAVTTPDGTTVTYDPSGALTTQITEAPTAEEHAQELMQAVGPSVNQALTAYRASNQGQDPPNPEALTPFFANPQDAAAFAQARDALKAARTPPH
jgi:RNA polymerase sigma factor (sigma-70 family)